VQVFESLGKFWNWILIFPGPAESFGNFLYLKYTLFLSLYCFGNIFMFVLSLKDVYFLFLFTVKPSPQPTAVPSRWFNTVRTSTGTWAVALGQDICRNSVVDIQCQMLDGSPISRAQQTVHCQPLVGVYCRNNEQRLRNNTCHDFRFRFLCSDIARPGIREQLRHGSSLILPLFS